MGLISHMSQRKRRVCFGLEAKSPRRVAASYHANDSNPSPRLAPQFVAFAV